jgi:hypothetical protein
MGQSYSSCRKIVFVAFEPENESLALSMLNGTREPS